MTWWPGDASLLVGALLAVPLLLRAVRPERWRAQRLATQRPRSSRRLLPRRSASDVRPGSRFATATDGPVPALARVCAQLRAGRSVGDAWRLGAGVRCAADGVPEAQDLSAAWGGAGSRRHVASVVAASRVALDVGAPLAEVLESVAASLAAGDDARDDREAALAGPRTTVRLLVGLPVVGIGLGALLGADPVGVLLGGGVGTLALVGGSLCTCAGLLWSRRLVGSARAEAESP